MYPSVAERAEARAVRGEERRLGNETQRHLREPFRGGEVHYDDVRYALRVASQCQPVSGQVKIEVDEHLLYLLVVSGAAMSGSRVPVERRCGGLAMGKYS